MSLLKDLPELLKAEVITQKTADDITAYYKSKEKSSTQRLFIIFGILGTILIGLGIVLIVAHNWDDLSKPIKLVFAFLPLIVGQTMCIYTIFKKKESVAWRESASAFLFLAVGTAISLVSQIYNIPGNVSSFLSTWMFLCLPLIFIMNSSVTSLLYLVGITYYAFETGYSFPSNLPYLYWIMLVGALIHYYKLYRSQPSSNFMTFHSWMIPLSIIIALGTVADKSGELMYIAYICLFALFYIIGNLNFYKNQKTLSNGFHIMGSLGTIIVLLMLSFNWFWDGLQKDPIFESGILQTPELYAALLLFLLAALSVYYRRVQNKIKEFDAFAWVFVAFIPVFLLYRFPNVSIVCINLIIFALGILTIKKGARKISLLTLNYGLLIITALVVCRFFDSKISFVIRGILFVLVGLGFFVANYVLLKKRNQQSLNE